MTRALARLNGDDPGRRLGNQYSQANRGRVQAMLEAKAAQGLVPQDPHEQHLARKQRAAGYTTISQRAVNVPRVGVHARPPPPPPVAYVPHRRTRDEIADATGGFERERAPPGVPTRSSDERKDELAMRNQFHGRTAEEVLAMSGPPKERRAPAKKEESEEEELRGKIADEVAERQAWLDDMRALGKAAEFEAQIQGEIAERLHDLKRLDALQG